MDVNEGSWVKFTGIGDYQMRASPLNLPLDQVNEQMMWNSVPEHSLRTDPNIEMVIKDGEMYISYIALN